MIVLEEGGYYTAKDFSLDPPTMIKKLYRNAGTAVILRHARTSSSPKAAASAARR